MRPAAGTSGGQTVMEASRRLLLLRHAAAEPFGAADDIRRELVADGRRQALLLGRKLDADRLVDARVLASSAVRVRQTLELALADRFAGADLREQLFRASESDWLEVLRTVPDDARLVLLAGHNPSMGNLASLLAGRPIRFATCDLVVLSLPAAWSQAAPATAGIIEHWHAESG